MSFIYRDRKDDEFSYGSTFCPYRDVCIVHNCSNCLDVFRPCGSVRKVDGEIWREFKHEKTIK